MNVARLNFSHGTHEEHGRVIDMVREVAAEQGAHVPLLLDLQGPKIRIGTLAQGRIALRRGDSFVVTVESTPGDERRVSTTYLSLPKDVNPGDRLLMSDGQVEVCAEEVSATEVRCRGDSARPRAHAAIREWMPSEYLSKGPQS